MRAAAARTMPMIPDPRAPRDPAPASPDERELYALAEQSLAATTGQVSAASDARIDATLSDWLARDDGRLVQLFDHAPSLDVHRHLWRLLALRAAKPLDDVAPVGVRLFAFPLVLVTGSTAAAGEARIVDAVLADVRAIEAVLLEHGALGGNRSFALFGALVAGEAIDLPALAGLMHAAQPPAERGSVPLDLAPTPLDVASGEAAHLRFLVGSALCARDVDPLAASDIRRWGLPLSRELGRALTTPEVSLLALPRPPLSLPAAVMQGRAAQREVAAQLFASHALRELRANFGEPVAVISAHVARDSPGGGELRLSLSSPLSPRNAHGFRCALAPGERVSEAVDMLTGLLAQCRVADVRLVAGVHPDRDPVTGGPLLFKPDTVPPGAALH